MDRPLRAALALALRSSLAALCAALLPVAAAARSGEVLVDVTAESGLEFEHFNGMSGELYFSEMMGSGGALLDYDRDGDLDVFLVQGRMLNPDKTPAEATFPPAGPGPLIDRLLRNDLAAAPDGSPRMRFVDVTERSRLVSDGYGMGVATGDYDNDGWVDLYVTNAGRNQLFRNAGDGTFVDVTDATGTGDRGWGVAAAFLDYDRDGWLDLFVGNYVEYRIATDKQCVSKTGARDYCGPLAYEPQTDRLYRNRGDGGFEEVSLRSGISAVAAGALGAATGDIDGNGLVDLYVANDQVPNFLWINQGDGTFANEALLAGCAVNEQGQPEASMGVVVGDLDGDGDADIFMSHLGRETNTLYVNDGSGLFLDASRDSGLGLPSWKFTGFGVALFDYDLDGRPDLFVANGAVKRREELVAAGDPYPLDEPNQLFRNLGGGSFEETTASAGEALEPAEVSRGLAVGDVDNDGDPDLLLTNNAGPARLLANRAGDGAPWVGVAPGEAAGRPRLGAVVEVAGDGTVTRGRSATDGSYASARDPRVTLGGVREPRRLRIVWPEGGATEIVDPPSRAYLLVPAPEARR